ncbi:MAG: UDP-N-acetylmuramoyl-tripeptide--D-alanyl-D-alanine ligase [Eubacteriales bacterium]|nr:UDP-N-acetylmuramoyl-tripeptide--D-alanyl-D-alanine ligase [Eubacteriales bacterium]
MKNLTLRNITAAVNGRYIGSESLLDQEIQDITTDSRKAEKNFLFAAIRGERVDGHRFVPQVLAGGAAVLVEQEEAAGEGPAVLVESTLQALKDLAEFYLKQLNRPLVGIVGSVGKTSTKEMVAAVLSVKYRVLKTIGNFNNEIGVPLTAFRMREEDEIGVLEMGINHFGEMRRLAKVVCPDTVVMTNIGTAHMEFLQSRDGILQAKSEVFEYMGEDAHIVLNGDDDKLSLIEEKNGVIPVRFGIGENGFSHVNDIWADEIESKGLLGISCRIHMGDESFLVDIPAPGIHMVSNALAGAAVGRIYGLTAAEIKQGIENYEALPGRFHIIRSENLVLVDDCYNANPASMKASLAVLKESQGRKVAILGDMGELGEKENELHAEVGVYAAGLPIDALYAVGPMSAHMAEAARMYALSSGNEMAVRWFADREELTAAIPELIQAGDAVLIKASHYMQFEKIVQALQEYSV